MATNQQPSLVAFPSISSSLHTLPQATNMQSVQLHPNMYAQRAAESEAKLQKALSKTPASFTPMPPQAVVYGTSSTSNSSSSDPSSAPIMMRSKSKFST